MNLTAWAVLGLAVGLGQAPAAKDAEPAGITLGAVRDVHPTKSRTQKLDIEYTEAERKLISHVELIYSRDEGQTWTTADTVRPDKDHLNLMAKDDGLYFVNIVVYFKDGTRDPRDPALVVPQYKMLIDSTPPVVKIVTATRQGDDVLLDWTIDEKYLNEAATQVLYKASANLLNEWTPVPPSAVNKRSAKFKPAFAGPIIVRVIATDYAENKGDVARELPAGVVTASYTPAGEPPAPVVPSSLPAPAPVPVVVPSAPPVVPGGGPTVVMPAGPLPVLAPVPTTPVPTQPAAASPPASEAAA